MSLMTLHVSHLVACLSCRFMSLMSIMRQCDMPPASARMGHGCENPNPGAQQRLRAVLFARSLDRQNSPNNQNIQILQKLQKIQNTSYGIHIRYKMKV